MDMTQPPGRVPDPAYASGVELTPEMELHRCPTCMGAGWLARDEPVPAGHRRVTNRIIERIYMALMALSARRLPDKKESGDGERKVAILLRRYFDLPYRAFEDQKKMMMQRLAPGLDAENLPFALNEARHMELHSLLNMWQDIPDVPVSLFLTEKDMPHPMKGGDGQDQNTVGLADIKFRLDFLYDLGEVEI